MDRRQFVKTSMLATLVNTVKTMTKENQRKKKTQFNSFLPVGIYRNPETGLLEAISPPYATGVALAK